MSEKRHSLIYFHQSFVGRQPRGATLAFPRVVARQAFGGNRLENSFISRKATEIKYSYTLILRHLKSIMQHNTAGKPFMGVILQQYQDITTGYIGIIN